MIFGVVTVQNFFSAKKASVGFSHQLEHLVNLKLLIPEESRKTALNDNLVSFSGRFREVVPAEGQVRYQYLDLIERKHQIDFELEEASKSLTVLSKEVRNAITWFSAISGMPIPEAGYTISPRTDVGLSVLEPLVVYGPVDAQIVNLAALENRVRSLPKSTESLRVFGSDLYALIGKYLSPALGIGSESLKKKSKICISK